MRTIVLAALAAGVSPQDAELEGIYFRPTQRPNFDGSLSWTADFDYLAFSADGRFHRGFPAGGLRGLFAGETSGPAFGRFTRNGDRFSILMNRDPFLGTSHTLEGRRLKEELEVDSKTYRRLPPCDRLKLEGTFVRKLNMADVEDPVLTFSREGAFREKGLRLAGFVSDELLDPTLPRMPEEGSGTYSIAANTLGIKYQSGLTKRIFFFTLDDPARPKTIVVNGYAYERKE